MKTNYQQVSYLVINVKILHQVEVQEHTNGGLSGLVFWQTKI